MREEEFSKYYEKIKTGLPPLISTGFGRLLENKHLYQKVEIDVRELMTEASILSKTTAPTGTAARAQSFAKQCFAILNLTWRLTSDKPTGLSKLRGPDELLISLPTIKTFCTSPSCNRIEPFNPGLDSHPTLNHAVNDKWQQFFVLEYICQSCKGLPTVFLVRREGLKLFLEGRSPIEHVEVPKVIPKAHSKYYSDAIVAHNSGQTLAGLFLLRTFVEQYIRQLSPETGIPADKLMEKYMEQLPSVFKDRFPSLSKIYSELSGAIHRADATADLFEKTITDLNEHFEAKKLFKIADAKQNPSPKKVSS